jgi:hypothetical protein
MSNQPFAATAWEIEAARRREVVESDFASVQRSRGDRPGSPEYGPAGQPPEAARSVCRTADGLLPNA